MAFDSSAPFNTPLWTYILTNGNLTLTVNDNIKILALNYISGTVTITGGASVQNIASGAVSLSSTNPNLTVGSGQFPINEVIINASSGSVQLIGSF